MISNKFNKIKTLFLYSMIIHDNNVLAAKKTTYKPKKHKSNTTFWTVFCGTAIIGGGVVALTKDDNNKKKNKDDNNEEPISDNNNKQYIFNPIIKKKIQDLMDQNNYLHSIDNGKNKEFQKDDKFLRFEETIFKAEEIFHNIIDEIKKRLSSHKDLMDYYELQRILHNKDYNADLGIKNIKYWEDTIYTSLLGIQDELFDLQQYYNGFYKNMTYNVFNSSKEADEYFNYYKKIIKNMIEIIKDLEDELLKEYNNAMLLLANEIENFDKLFKEKEYYSDDFPILEEISNLFRNHYVTINNFMNDVQNKIKNNQYDFFPTNEQFIKQRLFDFDNKLTLAEFLFQILLKKNKISNDQWDYFKKIYSSYEKPINDIMTNFVHKEQHISGSLEHINNRNE